MLSYTRRTESLHKDKEVTYKVRIRALDEYMKIKGITDDSNLPEYFIESANVPWKNRIDMQAALQNHIDTAISSTVNLKEETTVDEVAQLYLYAWEKGLKGITIFRENCNRTVILSKDEKKSNNTPSTDTNPVKEHTQQLSDNVAYTVLGNVKPIDLKYVKKTVHIGCGEIRMLISYDKESKKIYDYYTIRKGNGGGCTSNINSLAIIISKYLKIGGQLEEVLEVLNGSEPCNSFSVKRAQGHNLSKGKNCATAMVNMLLEFKKEMDDYYNLIDINEDDDNVIMLDKEEVIITDENPPIETKVVPTIVTKSKTLVCETCGTELVPSGGCWECPTCGFSKCGD